MESKTQKNLLRTNIKIAFGYGYKLVFAADKFSQPFKNQLGEDAIYNFTYNMIEEVKYYCEMMKKHFIKELVMSLSNVENSTKMLDL